MLTSSMKFCVLMTSCIYNRTKCEHISAGFVIAAIKNLLNGHHYKNSKFV